MAKSTTTHRPVLGATARRWLLAGLVGCLVVLALPGIRDLWDINRAGMLLNRAIVLGSDAAQAQMQDGLPGPSRSPDTGSDPTTEEAEGRPVVAAGGDFLLTAEAQDLLERSLALMDSATSRQPHTASRETAMWRTYGAAARLLPSERAFELLFRSRNAGRLDWYGELWLGEVAAATGKWDAATQAYRRMDASNLLVYRAEAYIQAGDKDRALRELLLAKASLEAQVARERARLLLLDRTGNRPSALEGMRQRPAERATTLWRIGAGLLSLGRAIDARPVLEQGLAVAKDSSPGAIVERSLRFDLAAALVNTLPERPLSPAGRPGYYYYPSKPGSTRLDEVIRIRALVHQALEIDPSAKSHARAGSILIRAGDDDSGLVLLSKAIEIDPLTPDPYLSLGWWLETHQREEAARRVFEQAAVKMPDDMSIISALAVSTYTTLSHGQAFPLLEKALALKTDNIYVFAFLSDHYVEMGDLVTARKVLEEGLQRVPGAPTLTARLAALPPPPVATP